MKSLVLALSLCALAAPARAQDGAELEARSLLVDVRAFRAEELPAHADLEALCALADELCAASATPRPSSLADLVRALGDLGHLLGEAGRRDEARALVAWSGERAQEGADLATAAWAFDWLGQESWVRGELEDAAGWVARAADADGARGAPSEHVRHLSDVARIRLTQGRFDEALASAAEAERVARASGSARARRSAAEIRGGLLFELGRGREALELCMAQLAVEGAPGEPPDEPRVRLAILAADVLADVGRLESAEVWARRAHELALDPALLAVAPLLHLEAKLSLGLLLGDLGRCDEALALLDEAAAEFTRLDDARGAAWAAKNRGFALFAAARFAEAVPAFEQAWRAGAELGVPFLAGIGALGVAEALVLGGRDSGADVARVDAALAAAEPVARARHERTLEWRCAALRGRRCLARGEPERALPELARAVRLVERWRRRLGASGLVEHALRQRTDPYRDAAFAAAALGRTDEALAFAALLQARVLDELCARRSGPLPAEDARSGLAELRERVRRLELASEDDSGGATRAELERVEDELDARLLSSELAAGRALANPEESLPLAALGTALREQGFDLALAYLVGPETTLVLRIDQPIEAGAARVEGRLLPVAQVELERWIRALREPMARLEAGALDLAHLGFDVDAARALHAALVAPLGLPSDARIALVTDGILAELPLEMLVSGGTPGRFDAARPFAHLAQLGFLGDAHTFVGFGSLARLLHPVAAREGDAVVLVAPSARGPRHALEEARAVAKALGGARIVAEASAADVALQAGAARLHFAAHGTLDPERPAHGAILLGASGGLESWQVAELDLAGAAIVLSACHSGRGEWRAGAGLAGLTRGFLLAGAREVVASAWAVDDRVTARFMELFYASLARGLDSPAALRAARIAMRAEFDPRGFALAHPAFWAAWSVRR
jgi:tetratricopeptide (TPR) repeat protein